MLSMPWVLSGPSSTVCAQTVDSLVHVLQTSSDYKLRLSAALNLKKRNDPRAIPGLVTGLSDTNKTVRGVASAGLGSLVDANTDAKLRKAALTALRRLAKDPSSFVRRQAARAIDKINNPRDQSVAKPPVILNSACPEEIGDSGPRKSTKYLALFLLPEGEG